MAAVKDNVDKENSKPKVAFYQKELLTQAIRNTAKGNTFKAEAQRSKKFSRTSMGS